MRAMVRHWFAVETLVDAGALGCFLVMVLLWAALMGGA